MSGAAKKLFQGMSYIEDDLIEELEFDGREKFKLMLSTKKRKLIPALVAIASVVLVFIVWSSWSKGNVIIAPDTMSDIKMGGNSEAKIGTRDGEGLEALNAEEITEVGIDDTLLSTLEKNILKNADYEQLSSDIEQWITEGTEGFLLSDTEDLSISKYNMYMIRLEDAAVANIAYEFLFSNGEPVGYVMFFMANGELNYNISLNTADTYGYYLDFLVNHKGVEFVVLTDGLSEYFLSEDNVLYNPSTGGIVNQIAVEGDCYQVLEIYGVSVSYEKIMARVEQISEEK